MARSISSIVSTPTQPMPMYRPTVSQYGTSGMTHLQVMPATA